MDNQQLYSKNAKLQVVLSAYFGDGYLSKRQNTAKISGTCEDLVKLKAKLSGGKAKPMSNKGWGNKLLHRLEFSGEEVHKVKHNSLLDNLNLLDELGIALWFYDDGSLHRKKLFYNLCTHSFSKEEHDNVLKPFFDSIGAECVVRTESKRDGRKFHYLSFNKLGGAPTIAKILSRFPVIGMEYKLWSSETIQKWSTLQEQWKSEGCDKPFYKWARGKI